MDSLSLHQLCLFKWFRTAPSDMGHFQHARLFRDTFFIFACLQVVYIGHTVIIQVGTVSVYSGCLLYFGVAA